MVLGSGNRVFSRVVEDGPLVCAQVGVWMLLALPRELGSAGSVKAALLAAAAPAATNDCVPEGATIDRSRGPHCLVSGCKAVGAQVMLKTRSLAPLCLLRRPWPWNLLDLQGRLGRCPRVPTASCSLASLDGPAFFACPPRGWRMMTLVVWLAWLETGLEEEGIRSRADCSEAPSIPRGRKRE